MLFDELIEQRDVDFHCVGYTQKVICLAFIESRGFLWASGHKPTKMIGVSDDYLNCYCYIIDRFGDLLYGDEYSTETYKNIEFDEVFDGNRLRRI